MTQQVFADAAITLSRMDAGPGSLVGLLYTIARRRFADDARRNSHRGERVPLEVIDDELLAPEYGSDVAHAIHEAIAHLPDEQRRVVCLKLIEGCSFAELLVDPRSKDSDGRSGRDEFWVVIERKWPASFDPSRHGNWGTLVDFHNVAGDVGWGSGSGVSAVALNWTAGAHAPAVHLQYQNGYPARRR